MIIQNLRSQNVLKYSHLVLNGIPEKGLIAISGRNESGKTAVVETICFGLFGRTTPQQINHKPKYETFYLLPDVPA